MWAKNITGLDENGIYRTLKGNGDELIVIGRCIKAGFYCSGCDTTNGRYDAVIDINGKLLRVQIKGTTTNSVSFKGGGRSGKQIDKTAKRRDYKYSEKDIELMIVINSNNGDCYIIPVEDLKTKFGGSSSLSKLEYYKENWELLAKLG